MMGKKTYESLITVRGNADKRKFTVYSFECHYHRCEREKHNLHEIKESSKADNYELVTNLLVTAAEQITFFFCAGSHLISGKKATKKFQKKEKFITELYTSFENSGCLRFEAIEVAPLGPVGEND